MRQPTASLLAVAILIACSTLDAQQTQPTYQIRRDVIRGRVTTDSGKVIVGAQVAATMAPDRMTQFGTSDSTGRFEIVFEKGTGDYLVHISSVGRDAFRKRLTRATPTDSVFTVDASLKLSVQQLAPVTVQAQRTRVPRETGTGFPNSIGGKEDLGGAGVNASVAPDQRGNLEAMASAIPGVSAVAGGGASVLGLAPSQNGATLNGLAFDGASVPRGARTQSMISSSTYDASRGGFSGVQTQVSLAPGDINLSRRSFLTLDLPAVQATEGVATRTGSEFPTLRLDL